MKKFILWVVVLLVVVAGVYYYMNGSLFKSRDAVEVEEVVVDEPVVIEEPEKSNAVVIGKSVEDRDIKAYNFGSGSKRLVFVGALHGGYEWNSAILAFDLIDYLTDNPGDVPADIEVVVIPVANPDGLFKVVGSAERFNADDAPQFATATDVSLEDNVVAGRFNANKVDLNRNFDCNWAPEALWRDNKVSGGTSAFSEPEAVALRDFFLAKKPTAVVFYHSASNGAYTSFCNGDALEGTRELLKVYSDASGYKAYHDYPYYTVTGDVADWLATQNVPAISIELSTHTVIEWAENKAGIEAMFKLYSTNPNLSL